MDNNNHHLVGAVDADTGDKAARFIQLCDAHLIPLLFLCDTPGIMVGPQAEYEAIEDPEERIAEYEKRVARLYEQGKAVNTATFFEIDDVIDPAESRDWIRMALLAAPKPPPRTGKKRPMVDTW